MLVSVDDVKTNVHVRSPEIGDDLALTPQTLRTIVQEVLAAIDDRDRKQTERRNEF